MSGWNEDNFLERLMPQLHSVQPSTECPDPETVYSAICRETSDGEREAIVAHVASCHDCAQLYERLHNFNQPPDQPGPEWEKVEQRLDLWLQNMIERERNTSHQEIRGWWRNLSSPLFSRKMQWAAGFAALLAIAAGMFWAMRIQNSPEQAIVARVTSPKPQAKDSRPSESGNGSAKKVSAGMKAISPAAELSKPVPRPSQGDDASAASPGAPSGSQSAGPVVPSPEVPTAPSAQAAMTTALPQPAPPPSATVSAPRPTIGIPPGEVERKETYAAGGAAAAITLPVGTEIAVRTIERIDSKSADTHKEYAASLDDPLVVDGVTVAPANASAFLRVKDVQHAGVTRRASLSLSLVAVMINGRRVEVETDKVDSKSGSQAKRTATGAAAGAAGGAAIGAIAGGAVGAGIGAGGGAASKVIGGAVFGKTVEVKSETRFTYKLLHHVAINSRETAAPAFTEPLPPPRPTTDAAATAPQTVELGQTTDQVIAALGAPERIIKAGVKQIYQYKDLKVTFTDGKVTDIQLAPVFNR